MDATQQNSQNTWNSEDVLAPGFTTIRRALENGFCADLYLQIFEKISLDIWQSLPEDRWHRLATIEPGWSKMYPIYTNPHTQRYRSTKHGNVSCIIYSHQIKRELPNTPDDAALYIDLSLPENCLIPVETDSDW